MKTLLLATAAVLSIGMGAAFAGDGAGGTATQAQWDRANGVQGATEQLYYGNQQAPAQAQRSAPQQSSDLLPGSAWTSNG